MKLLNKSKRKTDGRYEVPLIWHNDNVNLPDNFAAAAQRLEFLEKRLSHDLELAANFKNTIDMDMERGCIKRLTKEGIAVPVMRKMEPSSTHCCHP